MLGSKWQRKKACLAMITALVLYTWATWEISSLLAVGWRLFTLKPPFDGLLMMADYNLAADKRETPVFERQTDSQHDICCLCRSIVLMLLEP